MSSSSMLTLALAAGEVEIENLETTAVSIQMPGSRSNPENPHVITLKPNKRVKLSRKYSTAQLRRSNLNVVVARRRIQVYDTWSPVPVVVPVTPPRVEEPPAPIPVRAVEPSPPVKPEGEEVVYDERKLRGPKKGRR